MTSIIKPSTVRVAESNSAAVDRYKEMRAAVMNIAPEDKLACEIIITCQLALLGQEVAFKFHAMRLMELNVSKERLEQFILAGLGVTLLLPQVARTLDWLAQAQEDFLASRKESR